MSAGFGQSSRQRREDSGWVEEARISRQGSHGGGGQAAGPRSGGLVPTVASGERASLSGSQQRGRREQSHLPVPKAADTSGVRSCLASCPEPSAAAMGAEKSLPVTHIPERGCGSVQRDSLSLFVTTASLPLSGRRLALLPPEAGPAGRPGASVGPAPLASVLPPASLSSGRRHCTAGKGGLGGWPRLPCALSCSPHGKRKQNVTCGDCNGRGTSPSPLSAT